MREEIGIAVYKDQIGYFAIIFTNTNPVKMAERIIEIIGAEQIFVIIESKETAFDIAKLKADEMGIRVPFLTYTPGKD